MTEKYSCILQLVCHPKKFRELLNKILDNLQYEPHSVNCFYNEFKTPPSKEIKYNKDFLLENISIQEMKGITSLSIYDSEYTTEKTTPFIRIRFNATEKQDESTVTIEWIYFENLDFLIKNDNIIEKYVKQDVSLCFCNISNQFDTHEQSNSQESWIKKNWGKRIIHNGIEFQAAPIMYFGEKFDRIIELEKLIQFGEFLKDGKNLKIQLGDLYDEPQNYRINQRRFWKKLNFKKLINNYKSNNQVDVIEFLKRRNELNKKK